MKYQNILVKLIIMYKHFNDVRILFQRCFFRVMCVFCPNHCSVVLRASLVKCMRSIAETYRHEVLETALPEVLFASLVELMTVTQPGELGGWRGG